MLGSNWQLSIAELDNCLKNSRYKGRITDYSANCAVVEFETLTEHKYYIDMLMKFQFLLGGCQKIAKIYDFIDIQTIKTAFPPSVTDFRYAEKARQKISDFLSQVLEQVFPKIKNGKLFFAVSIYPNLFDDEYYPKVLVKHFLPFLNREIRTLLKKKEAKKAIYYDYPKKNIESGHLNPIFPHHVIQYDLLEEDRAEIIFGFTEEGVYIARTFTVDDPSFKRKIDTERPFKEFKSSISPKLAVIMLNFLGLFEKRESKKILDPFVGNGTILLFALLQDFQIYGSDANQTMVKSTIRNLNWLLRDLEEPIPPYLAKRIVKVDINTLSNRFEVNFFDGICTEPSLGPFYRRQEPSADNVQQLLSTELEPLYDTILRETYKVLKQGARLCLVAPIVSTSEGIDLQIDVEKIAQKYNFKQVPLLDAQRIINKSNQKLQLGKEQRNLIDVKKGQIVKRKIYLFEK